MSTVKKIGGHKAYITTLGAKIEEEIQKPQPDLIKLKAWGRRLEDQLKNLGSLYDMLLDETKDDTKFNEILEDQHEEEEKVCMLITQIESLRISDPKPLANAASNLKLPTLQLSEFDGKTTEWDSFWDRFRSSVDERVDLRPVDKFNYSRGVLKDNAKGLIEGFKAEDSSYESAVALLKETYDNPKKKQHEIALQLIHLNNPSHNWNSLSTFRASLESTLRKLEQIGCDIESSSWLISPLIMEKLPRKTIEMMQHYANTDYPQVKEIREALLRVINHIVSTSPEPKVKNINSKSVAVPSKFKETAKTHATVYTMQQNASLTPPIAKSNNKDTGNNTKAPQLTCILCNEDHITRECHKYKDRASRINRLQALGRCTRCTCKHSSEHCTFRLYRCSICNKGFHHTVLCENQPKITSQVCSITPSTNHISTALPVGAAAVVKGKMQTKVRVLYDQCSQRTFIKKSLVDRLNLKPCGTINLKLTGFLEEDTMKEHQLVKFTLRTGSKYTRLVAVVRENLPKNIRTDGLKKCIDYLRKCNIKTSDPYLTDSIDEVDVMIGADSYPKLVTGLLKLKGINFLKVPGGLVPYGELPDKFRVEHSAVQSALVTNVCTIPSNNLEEPDISNLWKMDPIGIHQESITQEEAFVIENYQNTVKYYDEQYWVTLPWRINKPYLPTNYKLALNRLNSNLNELKSQPDLLIKYDQIIKDQLDRGFIKEVKQAEVTENSHYIPHLAVKKDSKTTPLRIVFDCSAKLGSKSNSLNDCLYTGPCLNKKLMDVLLKFRSNKYAFTADISKAFLRIGLQEEDRDFTRFLWKSNPQDPNSPLLTYRFKSVLFGATSSPFLLQMTLNHHLDQRRENKKEAQIIKDSMYMDNLQGTVNNKEDLRKLYSAANQIMRQANMPLQEWRSNSTEIESDEAASDNILGLKWDTQEDVIKIKDVHWDQVDSKRSLLSNVSKIFDPLGMITPLTIPLKILIQQTWTRKLDWDDLLPRELQESWELLSKECENLGSIKFPRMAVKEGTSYDLHMFCDASPKAYGAVAYLTNYVDIPVILTSKARVAPLKSRTLPQLELTAMYVAVLFSRYIKEVFSDLEINETYIWSDSEVALQWVVNNKSNILYVKNRVQDMMNVDPNCHYHHLSSGSNPADLLTRGVSFNKFIVSTLWLHGPEWLNYQEQWPEQKFKTQMEPSEVTVLKVQEADCQPLFDPQRYNSWKKLIKVTKLVLQFIQKIKGNKTLSVTSPQQYWLRYLQNSSFPGVLSYFKNPLSLKQPDLVKNLHLFEHENLIRCKGRIEQSDLPSHTKFPLILPRHHHLTKLLILHAHQETLHGGVNDTLCKVRENFWIPKGRQAVKTTIKSCYVCKRLEGKPYQYPSPPPLPKARVEDARPFENVGVDYTGCIEVLDPSTKLVQKVYIVLFTCAVTRAVHLELATNLSAATFLNAFRRFVARRSCPRLIISDNATNFKLGSELLQQVMESELVQEELSQRGCEWKFIPPRAPWFGGFYERLIGVVKGCLRKVLFKRQIDLDDLRTLITEIECRVNNRPLTYVMTNLDEPEALTPSHLLYGYRLNSLPAVTTAPYEIDPSYMDADKLNTKYHKLSRLINQWQDSWKNQYLTSLLERNVSGKSISKTGPVIRKGDVVSIYTEKSRESWPLGLVTECYADTSGTVRTVKLITKQGTTIRTVNKLYPLESTSGWAPEEFNITPGNSSPHQPEADTSGGSRPQRRAAQKFRANLGRLITKGDV